MRYLSTRLGRSGLGIILLSAAPGFADTAAGLAAFKNQDYGRAYQEWKASADAGQAEAEFDLGLLYAQGLGVRRDLTELTSTINQTSSPWEMSGMGMLPLKRLTS